MNLSMNSNGLNHAVSLGNIEVSSKIINSKYYSRNYDSEDENLTRRNLRHTSSIELYPRPSVYSKGDIREQYCLTDRQLNSIDRPRRERLFGCLSRRGAPQSFLGVCVGRKAPSEENLATYAPFYKYPRYPQQRCSKDQMSVEADMESSYFRRQPASILSTSKTSCPMSNQWMHLQPSAQADLSSKSREMSNYHYIKHIDSSTEPILHEQTTPSSRIKHVSFARSHTLTSFENVDGTKSSTRIKPAHSQERLIGGKKPGPVFGNNTGNIQQFANDYSTIGFEQACAQVQNSLQHYSHDAYNLNKFVPMYKQDLNEHTLVDRTVSLNSNQTYFSDLTAGGISYISYPTHAPPSPEVLVVERKFRNAMKTQATQTDLRKEGFANILALSPRALHKIKVVSQGAQTNGLQNGKKLTKSLSEIRSQQKVDISSHLMQQRYLAEHDLVCRTQSEDPSKSLMPPDQYQDINFYEPPHSFVPGFDKSNVASDTQFIPLLEFENLEKNCSSMMTKISNIANSDNHILCFESNSLPRRVCTNQRNEIEYYSNSLPRKETSFAHDTCKHLTECSELNLRKASIDLTDDLLPPPQEYSMKSELYDSENHIPYEKTTRRRSLVTAFENIMETPFKRDDIRRQSMPLYVKIEKLIDGFGPRSSLRVRNKLKPEHVDNNKDEKEILIDFKPHQPTPQSTVLSLRKTEDLMDEKLVDCSISNEKINDEICDEVFYENIQVYLSKSQIINNQEKSKIFSKKISINLDECGEFCKNVEITSAPPSPTPSRVELLVNASTYPSSDSLANDNTRDHSDGIWNESQVTVLTAEQKDISDTAFNLNLVLTPSSRRKNLILQHQQRSSIDTDAMDFEEHIITDQSPPFSNTLFPETAMVFASPQQQKNKLPLSSSSNKIQTPSIAVTKTSSKEYDIPKVVVPTIASKTGSVQENKSMNSGYLNPPNQKSDLNKANFSNNDISECSTNTEEYGTCTDTSKRTPGIKTSPTTTTSSSVTQVPVSTQSSQMDKTHEGSSFESGSSLYSVRGEILSEDVLQIDDKTELCTQSEKSLNLQTISNDPKRSPTNSVSSNSSRSSPIESSKKQVDLSTLNTMPIDLPLTAKPRSKLIPKTKTESVSDEERSEVRYSSSGYYESPQDDDERLNRLRRNRVEEDRKRRKTSMKLDIEKENIRALMSPIKKTQPVTVKEQQVVSNIFPATSPNKTRRFRPKARRPMKKQIRCEGTQKQQKLACSINTGLARQEVLLDCCVTAKTNENLKVPNNEKALPLKTKSASEDGGQPKTKSVESLRSVSPGSDSVFYSEVDGVTGGQHGLCSHCGKEVEGSSMISIVGYDSVESIVYNKHEEDIVRPPSDFADSPITTKATQRLYKKVDKRLRSEERYHNERGRLYKSRQENIRAKSEERTRENSTKSPQALRSSGSSPCVLPHVSSDFNQQVIYRGHYDKSRYTRLTDEDVWAQLDHQVLDRNHDRRPSTESERSFHSKYQVILHRLVQRRCTLEMYQRQKNNNFQLLGSTSDSTSLKRKLEDVLKLMLLTWARQNYMLSIISSESSGVDKTILVKSDSGEFGFRIHGSKPVVVAAIEPDTPAESSGLEVGDIIICVNGIEVLDKHHTEVVKIAHDGCETLELQVARTISVLMNEHQEPPKKPIYSGYLWRQSGQAKGVPNTKKWVRRWFCLRPDNCLYYYKTEDDTKPVGAMIMAKHNVDYCPPEIGRPFAFKVDSGEGIPLFVAADSEGSAETWVSYLKESVEQENKWLENSAHNLYQQPSSILRPDCFGYLMKLGSRWCGWSKRYCVLKDACLFFYQDVNSKSAFGMACLHGYKISSMSSSTSGKKNSFELIPPESKLRHYYFCTESEMDKKRWISALEYSIDRWIKSG